MQRVMRLLALGTGSHYGREVLRGIHSYCQLHERWEYRLEADVTREGLERARQAVRRWKANGIIAHCRNPRIERFLRSTGLPVVNVSNTYAVELPSVFYDHVAVGRMAARHFLDRGFRQFAFVSLSGEMYGHKRCRGFCEALAEAGFECAVFSDEAGGSGGAGGSGATNRARKQQSLGRWLSSLKKPLGVMCIHDTRGQELSFICQEAGMRVPDDVAIVGEGNEELTCHLCTPPLSSVDSDPQRVGYEAARMLHGMLRGGKAPREPVLVAPRHVVVRQSSDIIAIEDAETAAAMRFVRDRAHEAITVKDILAQVPICRTSLEQRFKKFIGRTPREEITRVRLDLSKRLLEESDLAIPAVAERSGYVDPVKFSSFFRREMGMTPTEYRRKSRLTRMAGVE